MTYDTQGRRVLQGHPSTWPQEVEQLRAENERLRTIAAKAISEVLMGLARDAAEAEAKALRRDYGLMQTDRNNLRSLLDATEAKVDELHDKLDDAQADAKALRARVQELEAFAKECASYTCTCHEAYVGRQMVDPDCMAGEIGYEAQEVLGQPVTCRGILAARKRWALQKQEGE